VEAIVLDHRDRSESGNILLLILVILAIIALIIWIVQQLTN
jgi:preprotein translocase subunit SecE